MGSGTSAGLKAHVDSCSDDELKLDFRGVHTEQLQKLADALASACIDVAGVPGIDRTILLKEVFAACDDNDSGTLSYKEFSQTYEGPLSDMIAGAAAAAADAVPAKKKVADEKKKIAERYGLAYEPEPISLDEFLTYHINNLKDQSDDEFQQTAGQWLKLASESMNREALLKRVYAICDESGVVQEVEEVKKLSLQEFAKKYGGTPFGDSLASYGKSANASGLDALKSGLNEEDKALSVEEYVEYQLEQLKEYTNDEFKKTLRQWLKFAKEKKE